MRPPGPTVAGLDPQQGSLGQRGRGREMLVEGGGDLKPDLEGPSVPVGLCWAVGVFCAQLRKRRAGERRALPAGTDC